MAVPRKTRSLQNFRKPKVASATHTAEAEGWRRGLLTHKLNLTQRGMLAQLQSITASRVVMLAGRRGGKTYLLAVLMLQHCLKNQGATVRYVSSTAKSVRNNLLPIIDELLADCPGDVYPVYNKGDDVITFPHNGSTIHLAGCDAGRFKNLRGGKADLQIVDEASFIDRLHTVVVSVLAPQTLTTGGKSILASSAPDKADHEVIGFIKDARALGTSVERTIYERVGETPEEEAELRRQLAEAIEMSGGEDSPTFRREYCNELLFDTADTIVPEWTKALAEGTPETPPIVREVPRPEHCHKYVSWDPGFTHHSAVLFAYWDFLEARLVIEDEIDVVRNTTDDLAPQIAQKERTLWGLEEPFYRVMDHDPMSQEQMNRAGIYFHPIGKKDLRGFVNQLRVLIAQHKVVIHPRCKKLIGCLYAGTWAKRADEKSPLKFKEHPVFGHFDLLAALIYLARSIRQDENPFPVNQNRFGSLSRAAPVPASSQAVSALRQAFGSASKNRFHV